MRWVEWSVGWDLCLTNVDVYCEMLSPHVISDRHGVLGSSWGFLLICISQSFLVMIQPRFSTIAIAVPMF